MRLDHLSLTFSRRTVFFLVDYNIPPEFFPAPILKPEEPKEAVRVGCCVDERRPSQTPSEFGLKLTACNRSLRATVLDVMRLV